MGRNRHGVRLIVVTRGRPRPGWTNLLGIAAVGTLFFAREASAGIVAALQAGLYADIALVGFALVMTLFLPRSATTRSAPALDGAKVPADDLALFDGAI